MATPFELTGEQTKLMGRWARKTQRRLDWITLLLAFVPAAVMVFWGVILFKKIALPTAVWWFTIAVCCLLMFYVSERFKTVGLRLQSRFSRIIGRCASCGYDLHGLGREDDGCTICPECGTAWKLDYCRRCFGEVDPGEEVCERCNTGERSEMADGAF